MLDLFSLVSQLISLFKIWSTTVQNFIPIYLQIWNYKHFPISRNLCAEVLLFNPKIANVRPIQLVIIANIVSWIMNYHYAKFQAFIKKLTIDVIFRWL